MTMTPMTRRSLFRVVWFFGAVGLFSGLYPREAAADSVYIVGSGNEFGTLNLATGAFTQIGSPLTLPDSGSIYGMGFVNNTLYALDSNSSGAYLYTINTSTGALSAPVAIGGDLSVIGASSTPGGGLVALSQDSNSVAFTLSPPGAGTTTLGLSGQTAAGLVAVSAGGTIYGTFFNSSLSTYDLYSISATTGVATYIGATGTYADAGLFVNGTLYGFDAANFAIETFNLTTGLGTSTGVLYNLPNPGTGAPYYDTIYAAAYGPSPATAVPEPSSIVLGVMGIVAGLGYAVRRRIQHTA